jgi:hypothetical protein
MIIMPVVSKGDRFPELTVETYSREMHCIRDGQDCEAYRVLGHALYWLPFFAGTILMSWLNNMAAFLNGILRSWLCFKAAGNPSTD